MERIETLIQNLQQQLASKASSAQLLATAELLVMELRTPVNTCVQKVSVQMPYLYVHNNNVNVTEVKVEKLSNELLLNEEKQAEVEDKIAINVVEASLQTNTITDTPSYIQPKIFEETPKEHPKTNFLQKPTQILADALEEFFPAKGKINYNELLETLPTFSVQPTAAKQVFELNDVMVEEEESLNDIFKAPVAEVAQVIKEAPVKDLRKAIGINDKYLFINELFKGDEAMYEKCLKTINSFSVYPEAETWIRRELLVKMGWDEKSASTKQFYSLVARRFS